MAILENIGIDKDILEKIDIDKGVIHILHNHYGFWCKILEFCIF